LYHLPARARRISRAAKIFAPPWWFPPGGFAFMGETEIKGFEREETAGDGRRTDRRSRINDGRIRRPDMNTLTMIVASLALASAFSLDVSFYGGYEDTEKATESHVQKGDIPPPAPPAGDVSADSGTDDMIWNGE
jgi:hypothetical protein